MCVEEGDDKQNNKKVTSPGRKEERSYRLWRVAIHPSVGHSLVGAVVAVVVVYSRRRVDIYAGREWLPCKKSGRARVENSRFSLLISGDDRFKFFCQPRIDLIRGWADGAQHTALQIEVDG